MRFEFMVEVATSKLEVGAPLRYDLLTPAGQLLATAGTTISSEIKTLWLGQGIDRVRPASRDESAEGEPHLRPHDPEVIRRITQRVDIAAGTVVDISEKIARGEPVEEQGLRLIVEDILTDLDADVSAVLSATLGLQLPSPTDLDRYIAARSTQLSILSTVIATELHYSESDRQTIGMAGLLHDISLMPMTRHSIDKFRNILPFGHDFLDHPAASAHLLDSVLGLNPKISMAVAQVHEQPNGGGFPRGLQAHRIMPMARILSMSDAYLTLISNQQPEPFPQAANIQPCDAVAYLMHHVNKGRFDVDAVKALVRICSLYPVGSQVLLSDGSLAVVVRSSGSDPSRPVVCLYGEKSRYVDLSTTQLTIIRPMDDPSHLWQRISRKQLDEVLFR
jgi:HD-GYP domain-containing protein (c-di-GMP phosphodiesterase class II)